MFFTENDQFIIRCYRKSELAKMYFPALEKDMAMKKLRRWIKKCTALYEELEAANHIPAMKTYTAKEVRIIVDHLGEPY